MKIGWDEPKRQTNLATHGVDSADLPAEFFDGATFYSGKGNRSVAAGELNGIIVIVFVPLGLEALFIVSMRPASRKERRMR